jgi:chemotaxis signal transduction protein
MKQLDNTFIYEQQEFNYPSFLVFELNGNRFALESKWIKSLHPILNLLSIPGLEHSVIQTLLLDGKLISVCSLGLLLKQPARQTNSTQTLLRLQNMKLVNSIGFSVDKVLQNFVMKPTQIQPTTEDSDIFVGQFQRHQQPVQVINPSIFESAHTEKILNESIQLFEKGILC